MAITGLGAISALGTGAPALWDGLVAGRSGIRLTTLVNPRELTIPIAAEIPDFVPGAHFSQARLDLLDRFSQLALVAAAEAVRDAGLEIAETDRPRGGVSVGTGFGGITAEDQSFEQIYRHARRRLHPFSIPRMMSNGAAAQLSITFALQGPALCHSTACASAAHAIGEAGELIRSGRADVMLAGGADAPITLGVMRVWEAMRVLAPPPPGDPSRACRPFSRDRQGLVIGEGAAIIVLEEWERAKRRRARIRAELVGYGATADAGHITQPGLNGPARAIRLALAQAQLPPEQVDYVNAHGTATRLNDAIETKVIREVFGEHAAKLAVSSTKSMHGHVMGASPALELVATVLAIEHGIVPPTANYSEPDPDCDLDYVPNQAREQKVRAAISNSFAFGGLNAVLAVKAAGL